MDGLSMDHGIVAFMGVVGFGLMALGGRWASSRRFMPGIAAVGTGALLLVALSTRIYPALMDAKTRVGSSDIQQAALRVQRERDALRGERDRAIEQANAAIADRRRMEQQAVDTLARVKSAVSETVARFEEPQSPLRINRTTPQSETPAEMIIGELKALRTADVVRTPNDAAPGPVAAAAPPPPPVAAIPPPSVTVTSPVVPASAPAQAVVPSVTSPPTAPAITAATQSPAGTPPAVVNPEVPLVRLDRGPSAPATAATLPPATAAMLAELRAKLASPLDGRGYRIAALSEPELVSGQRGTYYTIELKDVETNTELRFDSARYTFANGTVEFRRALDTLMKDVVAPLEGQKPYQLYVRGVADRLGYQGKLDPNHSYREIEVLKSLPRERYSSETQIVKVGDVIINRDLPNLRAAYLRATIGEAYPQAVPDILDGVITARREDARRNAEIILFVAW